jgi:uncharacterized protein
MERDLIPLVQWARWWDIWLIFVLLGVVVPWRGRVRLRQILAKPEVSSPERVSLYLSTIAFQWIAVLAVAWRAWADGFARPELGLVPPGLTAVAAALAGAAALATLQWFNLRRLGRMSNRARPFRQLAQAIMPQSVVEFVPFIGLAVTAGICEEFLYRGFTFAVLSRVGLPVWLVVLGSAVLFGVAHLYQGRSGLLGTTILGIVFGVGRVVWVTLLPIIVWHVAVDIIAGIAGPRFLLQRQVGRDILSGAKSVS